MLHTVIASRKMRVPIVALYIASFAVSALAEGTEPLRVGVIAPLSGDFASYGIGATRAMQLANDHGAGARVELIAEDNPSCQSPEAVSAFHKLVSIDRAGVLITFCTAAAQAVLPLARARGLPLLQLTESGPDPDAYMLTLMPDSSPFIDYLAKDLARKYRSVALVANTTEVNTGVRGNVPLFRKRFEELGGKVLLAVDFPDSETDFRPLLLRLRSSGADAVVPFIWPVQQMANFLSQADQLDVWSTIKLGGSFVFEIMQPQLLEVYPQLSKFEGLESVNFLDQTSTEFQAAYRRTFNEAPPQFADYAYDAVMLVKRCGSDSRCMRQPASGVSGPIEFGPTGRRIGKFVSKRLRQGTFQPVLE